MNEEIKEKELGLEEEQAEDESGVAAVEGEGENDIPTEAEPEVDAEDDSVAEDEDESLAEPSSELSPEPSSIDEGSVKGSNESSNEEPSEESPTTSVDDSVVEPEPEKMLTQSQVNELVGRARQEGRESALRELYGRYGVSGDEELGDIFGRGQAYFDLDDEFKAQGDSYRAALAENALLKSRADESRWEDIKLILGGKGLDVTMENIESLIPSHPEWRTTQAVADPVMVTRDVADDIKTQQQQQPQQPEQRATWKPKKLGGDATPVVDSVQEETEEEVVRRLYGL